MKNSPSIDEIFDMALVGGGAAGALTSIALGSCSGGKVSVALIENSPEPGRGIAYSTPHSQHLLNVTAGKMTALPKDPSHFVQWLVESGEAEKTDNLATRFVPRHVYGKYIHSLFKKSGTVFFQDECVSIAKDQEFFILKSRQKQTWRARRVILSLGHGAPFIPVPLRNMVSNPRFLPHPWDFDQVQKAGSGAKNIFIVGTGLTMVDCVLSLSMNKGATKITALSRHGFLPEGHRLCPATELPGFMNEAGLRKKLRRFRKSLEPSKPWQSFFDGLRPLTQELWWGLTIEEKSRFLRHLRPLWESHRHRMAPEIHEVIHEKIRNGALEILAGRILSCRPESDGFELRYQSRENGETRTLHTQLIINATGPLGEITEDKRDLVQNLLKEKLITPHPLGLGIEVSKNLEVLDTRGKPIEGLYAIGGLTRGWGWEVTAIPEIREQAWHLGQILS